METAKGVRLDAEIRLPEDRRYEETGTTLGRGGMGEVKLCRDRRVGRAVARKVALDKDDANDAFLREAIVQGQLEHPSVVPIYDVGVDASGTPYFTMKRIVGSDLQAVLRGARDGSQDTSKFTRHRLLGVAASICLAVDFAHQRGVIHQDLKPANVMLGEWGEVYILDWGLAKIVPAEAETRTHGISGTPGYLAPELLDGRESTRASDIYALGAILYAILTLEPLNLGSTPVERFEATRVDTDLRIRARFEDLELPPELGSICVRATRTDPGERFASAHELHDAIQQFLDGDREVELRRDLSARHTATARTLVESDRRTDALREIGRALALDPENGRALGVLVDLLGNPPKEVPTEVDQEVRTAALRDEAADVRRVEGATLTFAALALMVPFALGVRSVTPLLIQAGCIAATVVLGRMGGSLDRKRMVAYLLLLVGIAASSGVFGSLIGAPSIVTGVAMGFSRYASRRQRRLVILPAALACVVVPIVLGELGIVDASYVHDERGILLVPHVADFPGSTVGWMTAFTAASIAMGWLGSDVVLETLHATKRAMALRNWHLRQLLPPVRAKDDESAAPAPLPPLTGCPGEETLAELVARTLPKPEIERLALHLDACASCRQVVSLLVRADADTEVAATETLVDPPR